MRSLLIRILLFICICLELARTAHAIVIVPNFVDSPDQAWTDDQKAVVNLAIQNWENRILDNRTVNVTFDFTHDGSVDSGGYLGLWEGSYLTPADSNMYPWTQGITHTVHFNLDMMDPTLPQRLEFTTGPVDFSNWDALSVTRHELGHALGFTDTFYFSDYGGPTQTDKWTSHIVGTTFDPGRLNVQMNAPDDLQHVFDGGATADDLMTPALLNGDRHEISFTDLKMLESAYHYAMIRGDLNRDGSVGFDDLISLARHYGQSGATWDSGDFNDDGSVGFDDLLTLARNYGRNLDTASFDSTGAMALEATAVPEPSAAWVVAAGIAVLCSRRRARLQACRPHTA